MKEKVITIHLMEIVKWASLLIFLAIMAWWVLGSSPSWEHISLGFSLFFVFMSMESRISHYKDSRKLVKIDKKLDKLDKLEDIHKTLIKISKKL